MIFNEKGEIKEKYGLETICGKGGLE